MIREIVLDTETTGLSAKEGHRLIEIGCVEIIDRVPTGKHFHSYINPQRDISEGAQKVHGISREFLIDKPCFSEVVDEFLAFIGKDVLVIHNAPFDLSFLNAELKLAKKRSINNLRVIDTLLLAKKKFPGSHASLDALCKRFGIDLSKRKLQGHGALLDAMLLVDVYRELLGGSQKTLEFKAIKTDEAPRIAVHNYPARHFPPSQCEEEAHKEVLKKIKDPMWKDEIFSN